MNTSYFSNMRTGKIHYPLSISQFAPAWYSGPQFKQLAPKPDMISAYKAGELLVPEFTVLYKERVLNKFDPVEIYERLTRYYTEDVTLLCYEKPGDFCHRHLVSEWLATANSIHITEL